LIQQVRQLARQEGSPIGQWVAGALQRSLNLRQGHG